MADNKWPWVYYVDHGYHFHEERKSFEEAREYCEGLNASLLEIVDEEEHRLITFLIKHLTFLEKLYFSEDPYIGIRKNYNPFSIQL